MLLPTENYLDSNYRLLLQYGRVEENVDRIGGGAVEDAVADILKGDIGGNDGEADGSR